MCRLSIDLKPVMHTIKRRCTGFIARLLWCFLPVWLGLSAQNAPITPTDSLFRQEMDFGLYLLNAQFTNDAATVFARLDTAVGSQLPIPQADSLHYLRGMALYQLKQLLPGAEQLLQVSGKSTHFYASRFYAAYNLSYWGLPAVASGILTDVYLPPQDSLLHRLRQLQLSGNALLQRNFAQFDQLSAQFPSPYYQLQHEEQNLLLACAKLKRVKQKSPAVAGMLSAVVPGLGKVYAGKPKQGIAAFLPVALMGAQAYENIRKRGINNGFSIFYTGLFSVFYIGNIWGSALSVHLTRQEQYHEIDQRILFDLHIPVRNIFGN